MRLELANGLTGVQLAVKATPRDGRLIEMVASTDTPDRAGDIVVQDGIDLTHYLANPVVLWAHDHYTPAIAVAKSTAVVDGKLTQVWDFPADLGAVHGLSEIVYQGFKTGVLRASSIGFRPVAATVPRNDAERVAMGLGEGGIRYDKSELHEVSACNVPANPEALAKFAAAGIDTRPLMEMLTRGMVYEVRGEPSLTLSPDPVVCLHDGGDVAVELCKASITVSDEGVDPLTVIADHSAPAEANGLTAADVKAALADVSPMVQKRLRRAVALLYGRIPEED